MTDPTIEEALQQRNKAGLILLIRRMIARHPDLEELIDLTPAGSARGTLSANPDLIRRQVKQAISHGDYGHAYYGAAAGIAGELKTVMEQATVYQERNEWQDAAVVYHTVLDTLLAHYSQIYDHDGDLGTVFWEGSKRLDECLVQIDQHDTRLDILSTLVDIILEDIKVGGYGFADMAYQVVLQQATDAEKMEIVEWVETELENIPSLDDFSNKWRAEAYGRFLLQLQSHSLTDEQYIQLCHRTGQFKKLVERLLELERVDEAIAATTDPASDYELLALADLFVAHGHDTIAEDLIWERAGTSNDRRLDKWLKENAAGKGDWDKAIEHAESLFWRRPNVDAYKEVQAIAEELRDWPGRRETILSRLAEQNEDALLTRIHLLEGDVEAALATLPKVRHRHNLEIEVAEAAEETHPREATRLYRQKAERLIAARGRGNYAEAAGHLTRVKELYERLGERETWEAYLEATRNQKPKLPALLDELKQAGL